MLYLREFTIPRVKYDMRHTKTTQVNVPEQQECKLNNSPIYQPSTAPSQLYYIDLPCPPLCSPTVYVLLTLVPEPAAGPQSTDRHH